MTLKQLHSQGYKIFRVQKYNDNLKSHKGYFIAQYTGKQYARFAGTYETKEAANSHIEKICKADPKAINKSVL
jgi:hypothetical protein